MLSKSKRLTKAQFDEVWKNGRVSHSPIFVMRIQQNTVDTRCAAVVPQKIGKKASMRNTDRRKVYMQLHSLLPVTSVNFWAVLVTKKSLKDTKPSDLESDIKNLFVKSGILA